MAAEHAAPEQHSRQASSAAPRTSTEAPDHIAVDLLGAGIQRQRDVLQRLPSPVLRRRLVRAMSSYSGNAYLQRVLADDPPASAATAVNKVAFVREEGLNLRAAPDQTSRSLTTMKFGQRVHTLEDARPTPGWVKIMAQGQSGYAFAPQIHFPPDSLIQQDPALRMIKVSPGLSFWALVKDMYGIEGNESTKDQNMNHFINAIRKVNKR